MIQDCQKLDIKRHISRGIENSIGQHIKETVIVQTYIQKQPKRNAIKQQKEYRQKKQSYMVARKDLYFNFLLEHTNSLLLVK